MKMISQISNIFWIFFFIFTLCKCNDDITTSTCIEDCINSINCTNCSHVSNVNHCVNVTYAVNVSYSANVTKAENCSYLINVTEAYNVDECQNSDYIKNSRSVYSSIDILNCSNCNSCENVSHALNATDVANSQYISNVSSSSDCNEVFNTSNCYDCYNVTNSRFCTKCHRCYQCEDCSRCIGYKCNGMEDCRYTKWQRDWIEPSASNTKAWKCSNPLFTEEMFKKDGYTMPEFLSSAEVQTGYSMCHEFEGNRSCCSKETTEHLKAIYDHFKETLELRAAKRIDQLKNIFEAYKNLDYTDVPNSAEMKNGVIERMREVKIMIYKMGLSMDKCGKKMLEWVAAMLCMGCLPDWRWQKYVQVNNSFPTDEAFFDFDPDIAWSEDYATIDLDNIYAKEIQISKQMCDAAFEECKEVSLTYFIHKFLDY